MAHVPCPHLLLLFAQPEEALQSAMEEFKLQVCIMLLVPYFASTCSCHQQQKTHVLQGVDLSNIATNPAEGKTAM